MDKRYFAESSKHLLYKRQGKERWQIPFLNLHGTGQEKLEDRNTAFQKEMEKDFDCAG